MKKTATKAQKKVTRAIHPMAAVAQNMTDAAAFTVGAVTEVVHSILPSHKDESEDDGPEGP